MTHQLAQPLIDSVHSVLTMMTQTTCSAVQDGGDVHDGDDERVIGSVSISGDVVAQVRLVFPRQTGEVLVQRMTGMAELPPDGVDDALGELCNMIVGSAKSSLALDHAALSCPSMSREHGADLPGIETHETEHAITTRFESEAGPFTMVLLQAA